MGGRRRLVLEHDYMYNPRLKKEKEKSSRLMYILI